MLRSLWQGQLTGRRDAADRRQLRRTCCFPARDKALRIQRCTASVEELRTGQQRRVSSRQTDQYTASLGSAGWHRRLVLVFCLRIQAGSLTLFCLLSSALVCPASRGRGCTEPRAALEPGTAPRGRQRVRAGLARLLHGRPGFRGACEYWRLHFPAGFWHFSEFAGAAL